MKRLFVFNPDCELAIANGSPTYMAPANIVCMADDLAYLPVYLAGEGDYVWMKRKPEENFRIEREKLLGYICSPVKTDELRDLDCEQVTPWGWSPNICYRLRSIQLSQEWNAERKEWYSRKFAKNCLEQLLRRLPFLKKDIIPRICFSLEEMKSEIKEGKYIVKAPWSSSGRGLLSLDSGITAKEKEWLSGMFRRQGYLMLEKRLDKVCDFAMEFCCIPGKGVEFIGWSVFQTGANGEYRGNYVGSQQKIENQLRKYITSQQLLGVKDTLTILLSELLRTEYHGYLGVDMMIYLDESGIYQIQPCVEINLRYNMGIVAHSFSKYLAEGVEGIFSVDYYPTEGEAFRKCRQMDQAYPVVYENFRLKSGYLNLTPVYPETHFIASVLIK